MAAATGDVLSFGMLRALLEELRGHCWKSPGKSSQLAGFPTETRWLREGRRPPSLGSSSPLHYIRLARKLLALSLAMPLGACSSPA